MKDLLVQDEIVEVEIETLQHKVKEQMKYLFRLQLKLDELKNMYPKVIAKCDLSKKDIVLIEYRKLSKEDGADIDWEDVRGEVNNEMVSRVPFYIKNGK